MKNKFILSIILLLIITSAVFADQDWLTYRKSIIDTLTAIEFDSDTIWLGTNNGIGLYDTASGKATDFPWNDPSVQINVHDIAVDHDGTGWIATNNGIWRLENSTLSLLEETDNQNILAAEVDSDNIKWFITNDAVLRLNGSKLQTFTIENGLPAGSLTTLAIDITNTLWIGTQKNGIISFDGTEWTLHDLYKPDVTATAVDKDNRVWFGDFHGMVYSYNGNEWSSDQIISKQWFLYSLDIDKDGIIWAASNKGIYRVKDGKTTVFTEEDGLVSTFSKVVKVDDRDGSTVWIVGSGIRALAKFDGTAFKRADFTLTGPVEKIVYSIAIDHNNVKFLGHNIDGISRFDDSAWTELKYNNFNFLGTDIEVDTNNTKWFTAEPGIVLSFDDNKFTAYSIQGLNTDWEPVCPLYAYSIAVDSIGKTWIYGYNECDLALFGYLYWFNGKMLLRNGVDYYYDQKLAVDSYNDLWRVKTNRIYRDQSSKDGYYELSTPQNFQIFDIYFDQNDIIWAFSSSGLAQYLSESWIVYNQKNSGLQSNNVLSVVADRNNTKWIGTDAGVSRFDGETWTTFNTENSGLCDNKVNAIAVETYNTIWFGTDNGVSKYTGEVITTSVDEEEKMPEALPIIHSYPNPFNPSTTIEFTLPESGFTTLSIYNISGQKVRELAAGYMTAGTHSFTWDGRGGSGDAVSSGIYITRLQAGKHVTAGRMVLLK